MTNKMITRVEGQVIVLERVFNAPRELVFKVFSDGEHLKQWWGLAGGRLPYPRWTSVLAANGITA